MYSSKNWKFHSSSQQIKRNSFVHLCWAHCPFKNSHAWSRGDIVWPWTVHFLWRSDGNIYLYWQPVCEQYHRDQVVCPPNVRQGLFTTAAVDNMDHNPSTTTATDSFHGTRISLFQQPNNRNSGTDRREHRILDKTPNGWTVRAPRVIHQCTPVDVAKERSPNTREWWTSQG